MKDKVEKQIKEILMVLIATTWSRSQLDTEQSPRITTITSPDRDKALREIRALFQKAQVEAVRAAEKAFGGCKKCYGKGYATVADGTIGYDDFGGEGFKTPITTKMKFCTCDRGKQLANLTKEDGETK